MKTFRDFHGDDSENAKIAVWPRIACFCEGGSEASISYLCRVMSLLVVRFPASLRVLRVPLWLCPAFGIAVMTIGLSGAPPWLGYRFSTDVADSLTAGVGMALAAGCAWFDSMLDGSVPKAGGAAASSAIGRRTLLYLLSQILAAPPVALLMIVLAKWAA